MSQDSGDEVVTSFVLLFSLLGLIMLIGTLIMGGYNFYKYVCEHGRFQKRGGVLITLFYLLAFVDLLLKALVCMIHLITPTQFVQESYELYFYYAIGGTVEILIGLVILFQLLQIGVYLADSGSVNCKLVSLLTFGLVTTGAVLVGAIFLISDFRAAIDNPNARDYVRMNKAEYV